MRLVLDANVLVSALLFRGEAARLHLAWTSTRCSLVASRDIILEYARVLAYPKFGLEDAVINALLEKEILPFCEVVAVAEGPAVCRDPDDDKYLWCARAASADALITGDKDLLALAPAWEGVAILSLREALARVPRRRAGRRR